MAAPKTTTWKLEPHTKAKHDLLRIYLNAWYPIISRTESKAVFIDGFAGPGTYDDGSPGSPIIALDTLRNHSYFPKMGSTQFFLSFIEGDSARKTQLEAEIAKRPPLPSNIHVRVDNRKFGDAADDLIAKMKSEGRTLAPTLAFIDPFGYSGVPLSSIAELLSGKKCELFLTLMVDQINRFLDSPAIRPRLEELFGTTSYQKAKGVEALVELYKEQLKARAGFKYVRSFGLFRKRGHPAYYLIHATRSELGVEKMKDAMWTVDPVSGTAFSDRYAGQGSLFVGQSVIVGALRSALMSRFTGQTVTIETLERFTLLETDYHPKKHLKKLTLKPMIDEGVIAVVDTKAGYRRGTFPAGTRIKFT